MYIPEVLSIIPSSH